MAKRILIVLALAFWLACTSFALFYLAPVMFFSPRPEMVLIAFLAPALWLICSVLAFIVWADGGWPPDPRRIDQRQAPMAPSRYKEIHA